MYPCTCMSLFIMSYCRRVVTPLSFTTVYVSHCSYKLLVGPRGDARVVSLMVNCYADISPVKLCGNPKQIATQMLFAFLYKVNIQK